MKKRALDKAYIDIETKYKDMSEDDVKKEIENLEKEIEGKKYASYRLNGEKKEKLENEVAKLNTKLANIKGYSKNKNQISKIIDFRNQLEEKLVKVTEIKENSKKQYNKAKKELERVNKKLSNEQKTMKMDQYEYNDLLNKKENSEKEMKKQKEIFEKSKIKIVDIKSKIGKCNLAWRTLFTNKTWDDIQFRATKSKETFTRQVEEEEKIEEVTEKEKENKQHVNKEEEQQIQDKIAKNVKNIMQEKENNLPTKVTVWTKIKNFFKLLPTKIKATFEKEEVVNSPKEKNDKKVKSNDISNDTKEQKDAFIEGLRQYVDVDYREATKKAKEQQYLNQHQVKSKDENQK